jgi:D-alanyl-D-alanine-carboxypeptidase/D-alanyl-D-alanine-endopeptidase
MLDRRDFLLGSVGAGLATLGVGCTTAPETRAIRAKLKQTVGSNGEVAGMIALTVDEAGTHMTTFGSSGVPGVALDEDAIIEIMSITKVLTALMLVDMVQRGEVAFDDPVAKHLPSSLKLHERGRPITLLDLASYTSGLPSMPDNLPPNWWNNPDLLGSYTEDKLFEFLSSHVPKYEPGTRYEYANLGFGLLGIALARRAGKSYEDLLIERVCNPLGLSRTRVVLSDDMRRHLVQPHDIELKPRPHSNFGAMAGAAVVRSSARDLTVLLKACLGLRQTPLNAAFARLVETRTPTPVAGTQAGLGWFITSAEDDEIVWKTGLSGGCNTFIGFSTRSRRGAIVLSNFLWKPVDVGTTNLGIRLIDRNFQPVCFLPLYVGNKAEVLCQQIGPLL